MNSKQLLESTAHTNCSQFLRSALKTKKRIKEKERQEGPEQMKALNQGLEEYEK